jgi:prepilin-type N-terminal cleavage/methylation domain-containing protein
MKKEVKIAPGFTLIELMVVIVILGILSAVIAPRIPSFLRKGREGKTKGNLATLRSTVNIYYADNDGSYPKHPLSTSFVPKYIKKIPYVDLRPFHPLSDTVGGTVVTDDGEWGYNSNNGNLLIDCSHKDLQGTVWSDY